MITEDYVSFEVAKLLKKKGFLKEVDLRMTQNLSFYDNIGLNHNLNKYYDSLIQDKIDFVIAPTLQMAMKWLREMHKIAYNIFVFADGGDSGLLEYIYEIQEIDNELMHVNGSLDTDNSRYEFYEEACEAGIKYCLENLI